MTTQRRRHVLAIDIGGTHVKLRLSNRRTVHEFDSSRTMTPRDMLGQLRKLTRDWVFDRVSLGFPGMVVDGRIVSEPINLGSGWVGVDFEKEIDRPVRIINDAVMQALGAYAGGRMLFLGFGTALGAVAILHGNVYPMELAHLPFSKRGLVQQYVGAEALRRLGARRWSENAKMIMRHLGDILDVHYLVVGGGNACKLRALPKNVRMGNNDLAFLGGFRLWQRSAGFRF
jgi:polyphosphate glucokinase